MQLLQKHSFTLVFEGCVGVCQVGQERAFRQRRSCWSKGTPEHRCESSLLVEMLGRGEGSWH